MAEHYCSQTLDSLLKLVHHSRSSILAFCVFPRGDSWKSFSYPRFDKGLNDTSQRQEDVRKSGFL